MPAFCDVALPVPLEGPFTYRVNGDLPVVGGRVLVPFRDKRLPGVVTELHDRTPAMPARLVLRVLDRAPLLDENLLALARWMAEYYIAPLGEVLRTMLPLRAEWKQASAYRITEAGRHAREAAPASGAARSLLSLPDKPADEYQVLDYLAERTEVVREAGLRSATGATRELLRSLLRRKWIMREDLSGTRDAARMVKIAVLKATDVVEPSTLPSAQSGRKVLPLNSNQEAIVRALTATGGRMSVAELRRLPVPQTTLLTLVKRNQIEIVEEAAGFELSGARVRPALDFLFTEAQTAALRHIDNAAAARRFSVSLLHGVTGSGKTAVYLAAMQKVLAARRSAIMLVPEIGLTPAAAAQLHQVFGEEVAILHSGLTDDERAEQWHRIRRDEARIVVGTRSAIFAPVSDLALVVVDEEQDHSYKQ